MNENHRRDEPKLHSVIDSSPQKILDHISGGHIGFSKWLPLQYHFKIYQDISHNEKHRFRHKVCDCV